MYLILDLRLQIHGVLLHLEWNASTLGQIQFRAEPLIEHLKVVRLGAHVFRVEILQQEE